MCLCGCDVRQLTLKSNNPHLTGGGKKTKPSKFRTSMIAINNSSRQGWSTSPSLNKGPLAISSHVASKKVSNKSSGTKSMVPYLLVQHVPVARKHSLSTSAAEKRSLLSSSSICCIEDRSPVICAWPRGWTLRNTPKISQIHSKLPVRAPTFLASCQPPC